MGAVASRNGRVLSTGYNGAPADEPHCIEVGCDMQLVRERERCIRTIHAETNALDHALGQSIDQLHSVGEPCYDCLRTAHSRGVKRITWWLPYADTKRDEYLITVKHKIEVVRIEGFGEALKEALVEALGREQEFQCSVSATDGTHVADGDEPTAAWLELHGGPSGLL